MVVQEGAEQTTGSRWREVRLGECTLINDETYSPKEAWPIINYLDTGNISESGLFMGQVDKGFQPDIFVPSHPRFS